MALNAKNNNGKTTLATLSVNLALSLLLASGKPNGDLPLVDF